MHFDSDFQNSFGLRHFVWMIQHPSGASMSVYDFKAMQARVHDTEPRIRVLEMKDSLYFLLHVMGMSDDAVIGAFAKIGMVACPLRPLPQIMDHPVHIETQLDRSARNISRLGDTLDRRIEAIEDSPLAEQCVNLLASLRERREVVRRVHKQLATANIKFATGVVAASRV